MTTSAYRMQIVSGFSSVLPAPGVVKWNGKHLAIDGGAESVRAYFLFGSCRVWIQEGLGVPEHAVYGLFDWMVEHGYSPRVELVAEWLNTPEGRS